LENGAEMKRDSLECGTDVGATTTRAIEVLQCYRGGSDARVLVSLGVPCGEGHRDRRVVNRVASECVSKELVDEFVPVGRACTWNLENPAIGLRGSVAIARGWISVGGISSRPMFR